jgi:chromosome partitioning protein
VHKGGRITSHLSLSFYKAGLAQVAGSAVRTIAFITHKGGSGKTTLAASLAVAAASTGEKVIALDFDLQGSLIRWARRRPGNAPHRIAIEQFETASLGRLGATLHQLDDAGFTLAIFDTRGVDSDDVRIVAESADLCLLPARPTLFDIEATVDTFRAAHLASHNAAFILSQCPATPRSARALNAAHMLSQLGVLAEPMVATRIDYQDAIAAGLRVTEYAAGGRAACEIGALWSWIENRLGPSERPIPMQVSGFKNRLAAIARYFS